MEASARITCQFLGLHEGDSALLCMPLEYIAGKMMVVRALTCGMRLVSVEPKGCPEWEGMVDLAAMVPLQVWNILQQDASRLMRIRHLLIGGGAINDELANVFETGIMVDLQTVYPEKKERYMTPYIQWLESLKQ